MRYVQCFLGGCFTAADSAAEVEQGQHHDDKTGPEADGQALAEACHDIADKAADGNNAGIGHLRGDVFDMRTGRAGAGQNGGVRNGRTVVAEDAARKGGGQGDQHQAAVGVDDLRHGHDNGDQDAEGSPGSAGGEAEEARQNEDDGGEKAAGKAAVGFHKRLDEDRGLQQVPADAADGPGQHKNGVGGHHGLHALHAAVHEGLERQDTAGHKLDEGHEQGRKGGERQSRSRRAVAEGGREGVIRGIAAPVAAIEEQGHDGKDDEGGNGDQHVENMAAHAGFRLLVLIVLLVAFAHVAGLSAQLRFAHGAEVEVAGADQHHHDDGEQRVEIPGNGRHKGCQIAFKSPCCLQIAADGCGPAGDGRDDADGSGRGVDDIGQLGTGDFITVRYRAHDGAYGKAVEIVVNKDERAKGACGEQGAGLALDASGGPLALGAVSAGQRDDVDKRPKQGAEEDDVEIDMFDHDGKGRFNGADNDEVLPHADSVDERAAQDADHEGRKDFLCPESQGDGDDGRQQGKSARIERIHDKTPARGDGSVQPLSHAAESPAMLA